mmetsp:Transcript_5695/g.11651  ORF Transcript_5695/g.11651 Transcript_5695/m.11651 type:complete len:199 (+) Transcript_5695:794-1390(+)
MHDHSIGGNVIGDKGAIAMAKALLKNTTIQELHIGGNQIGDVGAMAIAKALEVNQTLLELKLYNCKVGLCGIQALNNALGKNQSLTDLYLGTFLERYYLKQLGMNRKLATLKKQIAESEQAIVELDFAIEVSEQHGMMMKCKRSHPHDNQDEKGNQEVFYKELAIRDLENKLVDARIEMERRASVVPWLGDFIVRTSA